MNPNGRKLMTIGALLLILLAAALAMGQEFSIPTKVAATAGYSSNPQIGIDTRGNINVLWLETQPGVSQSHLYFSRSIDGGQSFSGPVNLTVGTDGLSGANASMVVEDSGAINVVWSAWCYMTGIGWRCDDVYFSRSTDGQTFSPPRNLSGVTQNQSAYPRIAVDWLGNIYITWADLNNPGDNYDVFYVRSTDHGQSFSPPRNVTNNPAGTSSSRPFIATDSAANVHLLWMQKVPGDLYRVTYSRSYDGVSFSSPVTVSHGPFTAFLDVIDNRFSPAAVDALGNVFITWVGCAGAYESRASQDVFFSQSADGVNFSAPLNLSDNQQNTEYPTVAADGQGGAYVVWKQYSAAVPRGDIFFRHVTNGGENASPSRNLTDETGFDLGPCCSIPWIDVDKFGHINFAWNDTVPNTGSDVFFRQSTDHGQSFSTSTNVSGNYGYSEGARVAVDKYGNIHIVWFDTNPVTIGPAEILYSRAAVTRSSDVSVGMSVNPSTSPVGSQITYTILVRNNGPDAATNVVLADTLPNGTSLAAFWAPGAACNWSVPSYLECAISGMDVNVSATLTITVVAEQVGTLTNIATVSASEPDPVTTNNSATVVSNVSSGGPVADPQTVQTAEDIPIAIQLTGSAPGNPPLTFSVISNPTNGVLAGTPPNLVYTPLLNFNGTDWFTFTVSANGQASTANVKIILTPVNDRPVADPGPDQFVSRSTLVALNGRGTDPDNETLQYLWQQVSGPKVTMTGTNTPGMTFTAPAVVASLLFRFKVTDLGGLTDFNDVYVNVLEDKDNAIFVSANLGNDDSTSGSPAEPVKTLQRALALAEARLMTDPQGAVTRPRADIYVDAGDYYSTATTLVLNDHMSLYGGFQAVQPRMQGIRWQRPQTTPSIVHGSHTAVLADNITSPTTIEGMTIYSADGSTTASGNGENSVAIQIRRSTSNLHVISNELLAGIGGNGAAGPAGKDGKAGQDGEPGHHGRLLLSPDQLIFSYSKWGITVSIDLSDFFDETFDGTSYGGLGGANGGDASRGGKGGDAPSYSPDLISIVDVCSGLPGAKTVYGDMGGKGGIWLCPTAYFIAPGNGAPGAGRAQGSPGLGAKKDGIFGVDGAWRGQPGGTGVNGGKGHPGAGGGGGFPHSLHLTSFLEVPLSGGGGGGGGGGGQGAFGGVGGYPGGASFGILSYYSSSIIQDNTIHTAGGGHGGYGGPSGNPGAGGNGASGGAGEHVSELWGAFTADSGSGGWGGGAGPGGPAGGGGGGSGGASCGIYVYGSAAQVGNNLFGPPRYQLDYIAVPGTGGSGGPAHDDASLTGLPGELGLRSGVCDGAVTITRVQSVPAQAQTSTSVTVRSDTSSARISATWKGSTVETTLISPSGRRIDRTTDSPDVSYSSGPTFEIFQITDPEPGDWTVQFYGADLPDGAEDVTLNIAEVPRNTLPTADAGSAQTVEATGTSGDPIRLDGTKSSDPDGDALSFEWRDQNGALVGSSPQVDLTLGLGTHVFDLTVNDGRGGIANTSTTVKVQDTTSPVLTLATPFIRVVLPSAAKGGATVNLNGIASATDNLGGPVTITNNAPALFSPDMTTVTFVATDASGNSASASLRVKVGYQFGGFLSPIRNDGTSIFQLGRSIPIKFQLRAADGSAVQNAVAKLQLRKITDEVLGSFEELTPEASGSSNSNNLFRFDSTASQYIYNLQSKGLTAGTYVLLVALNDGTVQQMMISIR